MELKQQDIYVALKLVALKGESGSMQSIGESLGMSASRVHDSMHRLIKAGLVHKDQNYKPVYANLKEFLVHGIRFAFVPEVGGPSRGMPTASFAPPLDRKFGASEEISVWPDADGEVRGLSFSPLHKAAPMAARKDPALYELLALVDAIRGGRARERNMASRRIEFILSEPGAAEVDRLRSGDYREDIASICEQYHVRKLALFGSAARQEMGPKSDIDLLAEFEAGQAPAISGLLKMKQELSTLLGRPVDLATQAILENPFRRASIMRDLEEIYAA